MFKATILLALLPALALAAPTSPACGDGKGLATLTFVGTNTTPVNTWSLIDPSNDDDSTIDTLASIGIPIDEASFGGEVLDVSLDQENPTVTLCLFKNDGGLKFGLTLGSKDAFCAFNFASASAKRTNLFLDVVNSGKAACSVDSKLTNGGATAAFTVNINGQQ
ncbi:hypothetical protein HDU97_002609 [Phlyctochytrium planicorne]|nr:hypothetical protein HDU97_002609 [Phlyctochytrium planicorne]